MRPATRELFFHFSLYIFNFLWRAAPVGHPLAVAELAVEVYEVVADPVDDAVLDAAFAQDSRRGGNEGKAETLAARGGRDAERADAAGVRTERGEPVQAGSEQ